MTPNSVIDVRGLTFVYPTGSQALCDVSFQMAAGESLGVIGSNGAGKTTLLLCLSGVLPVTQGVLCIAGLDPGINSEKRRLPSKVGIVFPNSDDQLIHTTVLDDVAFGPLNLGCSQEDVQRRVREALACVGAGDLEQRVPHHLSSGEKRRVALAGVLAMQPDVLLLDEPSLYLDPRGRRELISVIRRLPGSRIIAAHDLDMISHTCRRVLILDHGRVATAGNTAELLADEALMETHDLEVPLSLRECK